MPEALSSPLQTSHISAGARFTTFAGWRLPLHYGSILAECRAVRTTAGMFDVSHMGRFGVRGPSAAELLQRLGTNDLGRIRPGKAQYTLWCDESGGVIDDLIVLWIAEGNYVAVVNASRRSDDLAHLEGLAEGPDAQVTDDTLGTAMIAVQGPHALGHMAALGASGLDELPRFGVRQATLQGVAATISRTGYTGEDGVEIVCDAGAGPRLWEALRAAGVAPCGLGARDALRMEMGYPLYGHELGPDVSPLEAGVEFAVRMDKPEFVGRDALRTRTRARRLLGFVCSRPCIPAPGDPVEADGITGVVTSGGTSVVLGAPIGLMFATGDGHVPPPRVESPLPGTLRNRNRDVAVEIRELPLIERGRPLIERGRPSK